MSIYGDAGLSTGGDVCTFGGCEREPVALIKLNGTKGRRFWYCEPHAQSILTDPDGGVLLDGPPHLKTIKPKGGRRRD